MLQWANRRSFFRCVAGVIVERRLWLDACVSSFASKASSPCTITVTRAKLSASKDVDVSALACSHHNSKCHSIDGDAKVFESAPCMPYAQTLLSNGNVRAAQSWTSLNDATVLTSSSKINDKCLPSDVANASGETQCLRLSSQTLFKGAQQASSEMQQKIKLLESEQFLLSDITVLVKKRVFTSCSVQQLAAVLQVLNSLFPSAKVVHDILVTTPNVLLQPVEVVQQKLKLLHDFEVEEKVVSKLCGRGRVLSISMESLQKRLVFYKDIGLAVEARNIMFSKSPTILLLSTENNIEPVLNLLKSKGFPEKSILKLGQDRPEIFHMSHILKKYEYFRQLGFSIKEILGVLKYVIRSSIKNIEEHLQSLKDLGFTHDDICSMLKKRPTILSCSCENVKLKVNFLIYEQNRDIAEIVQDPGCLTYSLLLRMVPRFNFVNKFGSSKNFGLSFILRPTNSAFMKQFKK